MLLGVLHHLQRIHLVAARVPHDQKAMTQSMQLPDSLPHHR
jgi:hypothetical protein